MAGDLLSMVQDALSGNVPQQAASYLNESPDDVGKAISGIAPSILAALQRFAAAPGGASQLAGLLDRGQHDGSILSRVSDVFQGGGTTQAAMASGQLALGTLLGDKLNGVTNQVASMSGVSSSSAGSLLALCTPIILGVLGRIRATQGLNPAGLANLLSGVDVARLLPAGMGYLLGVGSGMAAAARQAAATAIPAPASRQGWVVPVVVLAALAIGLWAYLQNRGTPTVPSTASMTTVTLPGGANLSLAQNSFDYNLAQYLASTTDTSVPKSFVFDNLNFVSGSTELTPESKATVDALGSILKAYPSVQVRLEGYTDNTGTPEANQKLSLDRAEAVKTMLVGDGVDAGRLETAGLGQDKPIASNDTDEGRAKNRRLELVVLKR